MSRRNRTRKGRIPNANPLGAISDPAPPGFPVSNGETLAIDVENVEVLTLRLILAELADDPHRDARLIRDLFGIAETSGQGTLNAIIGYLLRLVVDGLVRGNGSTEEAAAVARKMLATAVLAGGAQ